MHVIFFILKSTWMGPENQFYEDIYIVPTIAVVIPGLGLFQEGNHTHFLDTPIILLLSWHFVRHKNFNITIITIPTRLYRLWGVNMLPPSGYQLLILIIIKSLNSGLHSINN